MLTECEIRAAWGNRPAMMALVRLAAGVDVEDEPGEQFEQRADAAFAEALATIGCPLPSLSCWADIRRWLQRIANGMSCRRICAADGSLYLERYTISIDDRGATYLHRFVRSDEDVALHNHPWTGISLILAGRYREERRGEGEILTLEYGPGDVNVVEPDTFHRVDLLTRDVWTLFSVGPRVQDWGFWSRSSHTFTGWREHVARGGEPSRTST